MSYILDVEPMYLSLSQVTASFVGSSAKNGEIKRTDSSVFFPALAAFLVAIKSNPTRDQAKPTAEEYSWTAFKRLETQSLTYISTILDK